MITIRGPENRTLNIAHRGASSLAPENTFAAFDLALEIGADGLEFDVQLSKDNIPVVIHDESAERTTSGAGPVKELTLAELKTFDAGSWFTSEFKGAAVPTLEEVLTTYKDSCPLFDIELKNRFTTYPGLEEAVLKQIATYSLEEKVIISSFNAESLVNCRRLNPSIRTGIIYLEEIKEPWHYARFLGCYSVHPLFYYLQDPDLLAGFRAHSIPLYPWAVNDPEQMKYLASENIEAIITDFPQELKKILQ